ncbi:DMT family transporter [Clostridium psychrophilum]|uniref:DMT family transporter n=1 Tax=Clostridium psychrophilum TaxID=132926 RepID=UPI001C0AAF09|nr:DMT family transporter [Clostridium psychrophilum]MBU3180935.1 DMT family transporter [Clostridium psychrophilum]
MYKASAVLIGILIAIMVTFNGILSNYTNQYISILIIHIVGLFVVVTVLIFRKEKIIIPKIPTIYTTLLIFMGQLFTGVLIDFFKDGFVSKGKIIGGLLIILGLIYNSFVDKKVVPA